VMCGQSGTYTYHGMSYRDTDWIRVYGNGETMTATCRAEFPLQFIFIYNTDCNNLQYDLTTAGPCVPASLSRYVAPEQEVWLWVGASTFSGVPCSFRWILEVDGMGWSGPWSPSENSTWGEIKNMYK
jgi:hypothetical protein